MAKPGVEENISVPIVLRVKRKRTEDPAEALVIAKIQKLDPLVQKDSHIFHFVGTLADQTINERIVLIKMQESGITDHIKKHVDHRSLSKYNPLAQLSLSDRQESSREDKKASASQQRFKVVSKFRNLEDSVSDATLPQDAIEGGGCVDQPVRELMSELVHLYDVVQEDPAEETMSTGDASNSRQARGSSGPTASQGNVVTCNATRMVKEKVSTNPRGGGEYVYDLYYTKDYTGQESTTFDWSSLAVYQQTELVHDILDPDDEEQYDDDDDSNDESNWRNDYPDEDELYSNGSASPGSEDGFGHSNTLYRHREASLDGCRFEDEVPYQDDSYWDNGENSD